MPTASYRVLFRGNNQGLVRILFLQQILLEPEVYAELRRGYDFPRGRPGLRLANALNAVMDVANNARMDVLQQISHFRGDMNSRPTWAQLIRERELVEVVELTTASGQPIWAEAVD